MGRIRLRDLVIVLPGISGSTLQRDGADVYGLSMTAASSALLTWGASLRALELHDPNGDDGIRATGLVKGPHIVPGLAKIDGYASLTRMMAERFELVHGAEGSEAAANYYEFAYDWRRDNRVSAGQLKELVDRQLSIWRRGTRDPDAKTILLAHSMGGLVSRYYLEVLQGWRDCRALVTFGTPFRGSVSALESLANGHRTAFVDMTRALRSFPSVYQLLPIYPVVHEGNAYRRVSEISGIPGVDRPRAEDALSFHREIEDAVAKNRDEPCYREGFQLLPIVGTSQRTRQSARLMDGVLTMSDQVPAVGDPWLGDGDGTVPRVSAVPIELSGVRREVFLAERHSSLQVNGTILHSIFEHLRQTQARGTSAIRGGALRYSLVERAGLSVEVDDVYADTESVCVRARHLDDSGEPLIGKVEWIDGDHAALARPLRFERAGAGWEARLTPLPPGAYRLEVSSYAAGPESPTPVHDIFAVIPVS